jgi:hypothetical protein
MGAIRTCCGYFCSMIALIAVPFFIVCIAMEGTQNQFQMYILNTPYKKLNNPVGAGVFPPTLETPNFITYTDVKDWEELEVIPQKMKSMAIAIGINIFMIPFCIWCTKWGNKKAIPQLDDE